MFSAAPFKNSSYEIKLNLVYIHSNGLLTWHSAALLTLTNNQIICMFLQWYRVIQELVMKLGTKFHPFLYTKVFFTGYDHIDIYVFLHKNFLEFELPHPQDMPFQVVPHYTLTSIHYIGMTKEICTFDHLTCLLVCCAKIKISFICTYISISV